MEKPSSAAGTSPQSTSSKGTASEHIQVPTPNDYTSTCGIQTPGGDEGVGSMNNYALTRELERMKKTMNDQTAEIKNLRRKFRRLKKFTWPFVQHFRLFVKEKKQSEKAKSKSVKKGSKSKKKSKKSSSIKLGRNQDDNLYTDDGKINYSEDAHLWNFPEEPRIEEKIDDIENISQQYTDHDDNERKSDETEQFNFQVEDVGVKS